MSVKSKEKIKDLAKSDDLLEDLRSSKLFESLRRDVDVSYISARDVRPDQVKQAFEMTKANMQDMYKACIGWGWKDKKKLKELSSHEARFLMCYHRQDAEYAGSGAVAHPGKKPNTERLVAFVHFRFEIEEGEPILYLYDIQVDSNAQGKGLGKFLMDVVELIAWQHELSQIVMTVFNSNAAACGLYKKIGYERSPDSPHFEPAEVERRYTILRKLRAAPSPS